MEANRESLSEILHKALSDCGEDENVYFQPPETVKLKYPCILYKLRTLTSEYANDDPYHKMIGYDVTYITRDPKSKVPTKLLGLPQFAFDRYYTFENLHHYAYTTTSTLKEDLNG